MSSVFQWTNFVRSSELENGAQKLKKPRFHQNNEELGNTIKNFYDALIQEPSIRSVCCKKLENDQTSKNLIQFATKRLVRKPSLTNQSFLKAAQENKVKELQNLIENGCDINMKDMYGWTALMCAVCNNAVESIKFLLMSGADINVCNDQQMTALDIAKREKKEFVIKLLSTTLNPAPNKLISDLYNDSKFYCDSCHLEFEETSRVAHQSSTLHLFNTTKKKNSVLYHIPEHNVGFQMLLKDGWDKERGLGPSGCGQKYPVKTVLKRDRKGLGSDEPKKARITHFEPYDPAAVQRPLTAKRQPTAKTLSKKERIICDYRQRQKEIAFRRAFHDPD